MRITVNIPSRGRPFHLIEAIQQLHRLASRKHEVTYAIGYDSDDFGTAGAVYAMMIKVPGIAVFCTKRLSSLGEMANIMTERYPADVYCYLPDDAVVLTPGWDEVIYQTWKARPDAIWWWKNGTNAAYVIVSDKWRQAAGHIFTDYFPFWWDDVWLIQLWKYASGEEPLLLDAWLQDRSPATHRMRDIRFWTKFYWSREAERLADGKRIAKALGWPEVDYKKHAVLSNPFYEKNMDAIQEKQGDKTPPTAEYLAALRRAQTLMAA